MAVMLTIILAAPLLAATAYVHHRLPIHTQHSGRTWLLRILLILLILAGLGLGWLGTVWFPGATQAMRWAAFLFGFGVAHVPAFFILYMKRQRGEYGHG